jgi:hypothetical protein
MIWNLSSCEEDIAIGYRDALINAALLSTNPTVQSAVDSLVVALTIDDPEAITKAAAVKLIHKIHIECGKPRDEFIEKLRGVGLYDEYDTFRALGHRADELKAAFKDRFGVSLNDVMKKVYR